MYSDWMKQPFDLRRAGELSASIANMIPLRNLRFGLPNEVQRLVGRGILARIVQEDQVASTASAGPSTSAQLLANALRLFGVVVSVVGTTLMQADWVQGAEVK